MALEEECIIKGCTPYETLDKYFTFECTEPNSVRFSCLNNFHYVSGEMNSTCINGSWTSPDPIVCDVDYLMQRTILAPLIAGSTTLVSMLLLAIDFYLFKQDSAKIRLDAARRHWHSGPQNVLMHYTRRQLQYYGNVSRKKLARLRAQMAFKTREHSPVVPPVRTSAIRPSSESMSSSAGVDLPEHERASMMSERATRLKDLNEKESNTKDHIATYKKRLEQLETDLKAVIKEKETLNQNPIP